MNTPHGYLAYSLGIVFAEIVARHLTDGTHFAYNGPNFSVDPDEVRRHASPGCPEALNCLKDKPAERPLITDIIDIEAEVIALRDQKTGIPLEISDSCQRVVDQAKYAAIMNDNDDGGNEGDIREDGLAEVHLNSEGWCVTWTLIRSSK